MAVSVSANFSELLGAISGLEQGLPDVSRSAMPAISEALNAAVLEVFEKEGAVAGHPKWPAFWWQRQGLPKPSGRRWQGNPKLLQDTAVLVGSLTPAYTDEVAESYTNVPYSIYHVSPAPRRVLPLRDFFDIDQEDFETEASDIIIAVLTGRA